MEVHTRPSVIPILSEPSSIITPSGKYECDSSPDDPLPNYFTCTLGQAAAIGTFDTNKVKTITDFIEYQAGRFPDHYAVGFPVPALRGGPWTYELLTFGDLQRLTAGAALSISIRVADVAGASQDGTRCAALLCSSTKDFLISWLALIRCGFAVLLVAAQCQAEAIVHLMRTCKSAIIFSDTAHWVLAERTKGIADIDVTLYKIEGTLSQSCETPPSPTAFQSAESTAYIFHTSGTSSGLPKPIPQSHRAAFGVLPCFEGSQPATFTTTPLYHGGIADCFRAWTSSSMIWLFPGSVPITAKNINRSLEAAEIARSELRMSLVKYFSSVPYVLQMLADDPAGMGHLKSMEIVGVGGAPLSSSLGGKLVKDGVHLISRFGSAECGFLLSSTRNFEIDKEWQYLRLPPGLTGLILEPYEANPALSQLIVTKEWPHVAKTNRDDGSYATSDLFEPHPTIPGAWRYHSRADSQITLLTGKKFDPAPIEDDIMGSCDFVKDALIVGDGQLEPSVLVRLDEPLSREAGAERWDAVAAIIERINNASQSHARIAPSHILIFYDASPLERSSKGTILRPAANRRLQHLIQNAYRNDNDSSTKSNLSSIAEPPSDDELTGALRDVVNEVLGQGTKIIDNGADFYAHGIDSVLASRIRRAIHSSAKFGITDSELPFNVVYDCGNITNLANFIIARRKGGDINNDKAAEQEMRRLAMKYSHLDLAVATDTSDEYEAKASHPVLLLTGATGSLGAHILHHLLADQSTLADDAEIILVVRGAHSSECRERVNETLKRYRLPVLPSSGSNHRVRLHFFPSKTVDMDFDDVIGSVREKITHIIHAAWPVNFSLSLSSFSEQFAFIQSLLRLAYTASHGVSFTFCSSVASVSGKTSLPILEDISSDPSDADRKGYSRSKWVAEAICAAAAKRYGSHMTSDIRILRIGQLTGATDTGAWNVSEAWPRMLSTLDILDCLPNLQQNLDWLPVDVAARAVLESTFSKLENSCQVLHLVNYARPASTWKDMIPWIGKARGKPTQVVEPEVWLDNLESFPADHPAKSLIGLWKTMFVAQATDEDALEEEDESLAQVDTVFDTTKARKVSKSMRGVWPVDERLVSKIWSYLEGSKS